MTFPRKDFGPQRVVAREVDVKKVYHGHEVTRTSIRVFTGPRKALQCR